VQHQIAPVLHVRLSCIMENDDELWVAGADELEDCRKCVLNKWLASLWPRQEA
jgi:hypothetical protein